MEIITKYHLPCSWNTEILHQVKQFSNSVRKTKSHRDLSRLNFVTIDGETAKDFDDAVFADQKENGFDLYVAIADVSNYVKNNSPIDDEAKKKRRLSILPKICYSDAT